MNKNVQYIGYFCQNQDNNNASKYYQFHAGWGGEDDDFSLNRLYAHKIPLMRARWPAGKYSSLKHLQSARTKENEKKISVPLSGKDWGLKNLSYRVIKDESRPLYRRILVDL